jgi:hypothetical protein
LLLVGEWVWPALRAQLPARWIDTKRGYLKTCRYSAAVRGGRSSPVQSSPVQSESESESESESDLDLDLDLGAGGQGA